MGFVMRLNSRDLVNDPKNGAEVYPITATNAVFREGGESLESILTRLGNNADRKVINDISLLNNGLDIDYTNGDTNRIVLPESLHSFNVSTNNNNNTYSLDWSYNGGTTSGSATITNSKTTVSAGSSNVTISSNTENNVTNYAISVSEPTVNNSTITLKHGTSSSSDNIGSFTLNQSNASTLYIPKASVSNTGNTANFNSTTKIATVDGQDLNITLPSVPTPTYGTLTLKQGTSTLGTFTANSSTSIDIPNQSVDNTAFDIDVNSWDNFSVGGQSDYTKSTWNSIPTTCSFLEAVAFSLNYRTGGVFVRIHFISDVEVNNEIDTGIDTKNCEILGHDRTLRMYKTNTGQSTSYTFHNLIFKNGVLDIKDLRIFRYPSKGHKPTNVENIINFVEENYLGLVYINLDTVEFHNWFDYNDSYIIKDTNILFKIRTCESLKIYMYNCHIFNRPEAVSAGDDRNWNYKDKRLRIYIHYDDIVSHCKNYAIRILNQVTLTTKETIEQVEQSMVRVGANTFELYTDHSDSTTQPVPVNTYSYMMVDSDLVTYFNGTSIASNLIYKRLFISRK